jgi:hypothetical protein
MCCWLGFCPHYNLTFRLRLSPSLKQILGLLLRFSYHVLMGFVLTPVAQPVAMDLALRVRTKSGVTITKCLVIQLASVPALNLVLHPDPSLFLPSNLGNMVPEIQQTQMFVRQLVMWIKLPVWKTKTECDSWSTSHSASLRCSSP